MCVCVCVCVVCVLCVGLCLWSYVLGHIHIYIYIYIYIPGGKMKLFQMQIGVLQGDTMTALLFIIVLDYASNH